MSRIPERFYFPVFHFKRKLEIIRIRIRTSSLPEPLRRNTTRHTRSLAQRAAGFRSRAFASFRVPRLLPLPSPSPPCLRFLSPVPSLPLPISSSSFPSALSNDAFLVQVAPHKLQERTRALCFSLFSPAPLACCRSSPSPTRVCNFGAGRFPSSSSQKRLSSPKKICLNETELICSLGCCWDSGVVVPSAESPRHSVCICART